MRQREVIGFVVLFALLSGGCSRLTFVKPNLKRHNYRQTAPDYAVKDDPRDAQRIAAIDHVTFAEQQLNAGRLDEAQKEVQAVLKADPKSADAYMLLGMIAEQRGNAAAAGPFYAKAVALAPGRGAALNNFGAWLCGNGRAPQSLSLFDQALADPAYATPASALANAGSCALTAGQGARSVQYLDAALQLDPANPVALEAMAESHYRAGQYMEARAFSERRMAAAPPSVTVLQLASQIEQKLGDTAAAARYVQRIGQEFPQAKPVSPGDASQP
ncbi:MAG: pilF [Xanthomonadaceae bacterium]|nr:pilF [Xanthomonadaceae bacterium]